MRPQPGIEPQPLNSAANALPTKPPRNQLFSILSPMQLTEVVLGDPIQGALLRH